MAGAWRAFPLLILPAILYGMLAFAMGDEGMRQSMATIAISLRLPSGAEWMANRGHLILFFSAFMLFLEMLKATRATTTTMVENALALLAFSVALGFFLLVPAFGTMEFFLIMSMMLIDFMASAVVMMFVSRRDVAYL
ncbi:MAG: hypothetical protein ABW199_03430 [Caulobacterales bacterium]